MAEHLGGTAEELVMCSLKDECGATVCIHNVPHKRRDTCNLTTKMKSNICLRSSYTSCSEIEPEKPEVSSRILTVLSINEAVRVCKECPMHVINYTDCSIEESCYFNKIRDLKDAAIAKGYKQIEVIGEYDEQMPFHPSCPLPENQRINPKPETDCGFKVSDYLLTKQK